MRVKFWGTRGSIPTPLTSDAIEQKIREALKGAAGLNLKDPDVLDHYMARLPPFLQSAIGGNTPCVEVQSGKQLLIMDAGSGMGDLSRDLLKRGVSPHGTHFDILMTHTHWDHIQGFPFFDFAFQPDNCLTFYSAIDDLEERIGKLLDSTWSPNIAGKVPAKMNFVYMPVGKPYQLSRLCITPIVLSHPGGSYAYRIDDGISRLVYATDAAYESLEKQYVDFFYRADLLIFDAHFNFAESIDKVDWGHSTAMFGAEFAYRAQIKRLALFHHNPTDDDEVIHRAMQQAQNYLGHRTFLHGPCQVITAHDGMELEI